MRAITRRTTTPFKKPKHYSQSHQVHLEVWVSTAEVGKPQTQPSSRGKCYIEGTLILKHPARQDSQ